MIHFLRCINAVGCVKTRHVPRCIHKMQAILSVEGLGTCDALLWASHTLLSASESGQEAGIVQIDFSAAFDRVNHQGNLYKLCSVGI